MGLAEDNLDGVARGLRAPGSQQANAEELLAELVRLVESSGLTAERSRPPAGTVSEPTPPSVAAPSSKPREPGAVDFEPPRAAEFNNSYSNDANGTDFVTPRRAGAWKFGVSALLLVGAAGVGSIFWLKRVEPEPPIVPPSIATTEDPTTTQPPSNSTVAASSEAGVTPRDVTQPAQDKGASPEERPIDLNAHVLLDKPPQSDLAPKPTGAAQPTADASAGKPVTASVNNPAVAPPIATPQPMASQSPDPKPVPAVSLPPDSTQIATPTPSTADSGAAPSIHAPLPPVRPAPKASIEAAGAAQRSTSKLDLPTKLSSKSEARVVAARADAAAKAPVERSEPPQREASLKPEKGGKTLNATQAPAEAQAGPSGQPVAAQPRSNPNPVVRTFTNMVGAIAGLIPFVPH